MTIRQMTASNRIPSASGLIAARAAEGSAGSVCRKRGPEPSPQRSSKVSLWIGGAALIAATVIGSKPVTAQDETYAQFATTGSYLDASDELRDGYVAGLVDAIIAFDLLDRSTIHCVSAMRIREIRSHFDLWLRNHPVDWRYSLPTNFRRAARRFCE